MERVQQAPIVSANSPLQQPDPALIRRIAKAFSFAIDGQKALDQQVEECLQKIANNIRSGKWATIEEKRNDVGKLLDQQGRTILHREMDAGFIENAKKLINKEVGTAIIRDKSGDTLLHYAVRKGDVELIGMICPHLCRINEENESRLTALNLAVELGKTEIVRCLKDLGANLESQVMYKKHSLRPLEYAIALGRIDCFKILFREADVDSRNGIGTLLHLAVYFHQNDILNELLQKPGCMRLLEVKDGDGNTPFALAVKVQNVEAAHELRQRNANIDAQNNNKETPLHIAVRLGKPQLVEVLVEWGCKIFVPNGFGKIPQVLAVDNRIEIYLGHVVQAMQGREFEPPNFLIEPPENVVLMGGGPRGIAYVPAITVLAQRGLLKNLKRVAGTSAGAITALFLSLNYSPEEMKSILSEKDLGSFLDFRRKGLFGIRNNVWSALSTILGDFFLNFSKVRLGDFASNPLKAFFPGGFETGLCQGSKLHQWFEEAIAAKTGDKYFTFGELRKHIAEGNPKKFRHLHIFALKLNKGASPELVRFSSEDRKYDSIIIADAVRASMSIPFVFEACQVRIKTDLGPLIQEHLGTFVDGGLAKNFPIDAFDTQGFQNNHQGNADFPIYNKRTLGFALYDASEKLDKGSPIAMENWSDVAQGVAKAFYSTESLLIKKIPFHQFRVIEIDNKGVGLTEFNMPEAKKTALLGSGEAAANAFLDHQQGTRPLTPPIEIPQLQLALQCNINPKHSYEYFVGREQLLQEMKTNLIDLKQSICLYGALGIGKTELALKFIADHSRRFNLIARIDCSDLDEKTESYKELARELKLNENQALEGLIKDVHQHLENVENKPWLLFFDQLDDCTEIPQCKGGVVIATSTKEQTRCKSIEVPLFSEEEALSLIQRISGRDADEKMRLLTQKLVYYHPILIDQFAQWMNKNPNMSMDQFLESLSNFDVSRLEKLERNKTDIEKILSSALSVLPPDALDWLKICAYLDHNAISIFLLEAWLKNNNILKPAERALELINCLTKSGFARQEATTQITISPLILAYLKKSDSSKGRFLKEALHLIGTHSDIDMVKNHFIVLLSNPDAMKILTQDEDLLLQTLNSDNFKRENSELLKTFRSFLERQQASQDASQIDYKSLLSNLDQSCNMQ